jgi:hypothetical protein
MKSSLFIPVQRLWLNHRHVSPTHNLTFHLRDKMFHRPTTFLLRKAIILHQEVILFIANIYNTHLRIRIPVFNGDHRLEAAIRGPDFGSKNCVMLLFAEIYLRGVIQGSRFMIDISLLYQPKVPLFPVQSSQRIWGSEEIVTLIVIYN